MIDSWYVSKKNQVFEDDRAVYYISKIKSPTPGPYYISFRFDLLTQSSLWKSLSDPDEGRWSGWEETSERWFEIDEREVLDALFEWEVE